MGGRVGASAALGLGSETSDVGRWVAWAGVSCLLLVAGSGGLCPGGLR